MVTSTLLFTRTTCGEEMTIKHIVLVAFWIATTAVPAICAEEQLDIGESHCNDFSVRQKAAEKQLKPIYFEINKYFESSSPYHQILERLAKVKDGSICTISFWVKKSRGGVISSISKESVNLHVDSLMKTLISNLPAIEIPPQIKAIALRLNFHVNAGKVSSKLESKNVVLPSVQ